ncbi:MAG: trigger factor [Thermoleophilaceae bacterium]
MSAVKTDTEELESSRVRVQVEVESQAFERQLATAAEEIGRDMRVPGFRTGKVPAQVVLQQVGREAVVEQAVRRGLPEWYEEAVRDAGLAVVGSPDLNVDDLPAKGAPLSFTIEVAVRPQATLGDWRGVEAPRRDPDVADEDVEAEIGRLRESLASLETVEKAAEMGDYVVIDFVGSLDGEPFEGGDARGFLLELGSDRLIPGFEEQLEGVSAGDEREVRVVFPQDYQAEHMVGKEASFAVEVKEVKTKKLPEADDDLAIEAGGYDSLDELRSLLRERLTEAQEEAIVREFRDAAVDAVAAKAEIDVPHDLVHFKAHDMWQQTSHRLSHQGLDPAQYLQFANKTEAQMITEAEPEAERALRQEATLAAVVATEGIEVSDEEMLDALRRASAEPGEPEPSEKDLRRSLENARKKGQDAVLREDIAMRKAVDLVVEHAKPVPAPPPEPREPVAPARPEAREEIWTPEQDKPEKKAIWTPGE